MNSGHISNVYKSTEMYENIISPINSMFLEGTSHNTSDIKRLSLWSCGNTFYFAFFSLQIRHMRRSIWLIWGEYHKLKTIWVCIWFYIYIPKREFASITRRRLLLTTEEMKYTNFLYKQLLYKQVSTRQEKNLSNSRTGSRNAKQFGNYC